jgi:peptidoglycan/LPS O-acetylase OafA/YrhL
VTQPTSDRSAVYAWQTAIAVALFGTVAAVGLIIVFTYMDDYIGAFWSQAIYFLAFFAGVIALAERSRRLDHADPSRLADASQPVTPAGLPGPFVCTQAFGVLGVAMIVAGFLIGGGRGLIWIFSGIVLALVGAVGLAFWGGTMLSRRRAPQRR